MTTRSEPDDDINYSELALIVLEQHGAQLTTADVARAWMNLLPAGATFTAERAAYRVLLQRARDRFTWGGEPGFDLIPEQWTQPWQGRVAVSLAGYGEVGLDTLVERTVRVAQNI